MAKYRLGKTITIGNIGREQFTQTIERRGMKVTRRSAYMMKQDAFIVAPQVQQIQLADASVREMGFTGLTRFDAICGWIKEHGDLCQPEDGPQLRLQYLDQPMGEVLVIAMEAIRDSDGNLRVFSVGHCDVDLWLLGRHGRPDVLWSPDGRFVFRARKQPSDA